MAAKKRSTRKVRRIKQLYVVVGVQGPMKHYEFLGIKADQAKAVKAANEHYLLAGKKGVVLAIDSSDGMTHEVFRSNG